MQFTFDSQNPTELRAVEAAVAVLVSGLATPERTVLEDVVAKMKDLPGAVVSGEGLTVTGSGTTETIHVDTLGAVAAPAALVPTPPVATGGSGGTGVAVYYDSEGEYARIRAGSFEGEPETDSAGQPWDAELHSSSRAKIADGTWKKKRNAGKPAEVPLPDNALIDAARGRDPVPAPPVPPAPPATELITMNQIWALITNNQATLNDVLAAAQRMGFADLGAVAQTATNEQRAALLKELTV